MAVSKEVEEFIEKNIGKDNYCFLSGYLKYSSSSRLQCAEIVLNAYKRLVNNDIGEDLDQEERNNLKGALTIDMLSKVMMAIEDFGAILIAIADLHNFSKKFLETKSVEARNIFKELIKKDNIFFQNLLTYSDIDSLPIESQDKDFLKRTYERNIAVMKQLFMKIIEFTEKHKRAFLKSKHGYPILLGIEMADLGEGIDMIVPVLYKSEPNHRSTIVLSGLRVNELYFGLIKTISVFMKDIIYSKLLMLECAGYRQPLYRAYCRLSDKEKQKIAEINEKCSLGKTRPTVQINFVVQGKESDMAELQDFFNKNWYIEG